MTRRRVVPAAFLAAACQTSSGVGQGTDTGDPVEVGFFVTSQGSGNGGDLGGLAGADARCQELATAAGLPARDWRAYLSATGPIHARDRIGAGPWLNAVGTIVAADLDALAAGVASEDMLDEFGDPAGKDPPPGAEHDILTGSDLDGRLHSSEATCADWTSNRREDRVVVGHHDWGQLSNDQWTQSWISVHSAPCDTEGMAAQLGAARTYCFAAD
ncbi:MAG: hypothetical protein AAF721_35420 [Myxococcota bacterium]